MRWQPSTLRHPVLDGVDLRVKDGERVLLAGASGAGKSTLMRAIAGLLVEEAGELAGSVMVRGEAPDRSPGTVGLVQQDPGTSLVAVTAGRDTAFGPENLGLPATAVARRVAAAWHAAGFPYSAARRSSALSGGERQRLVLAGLLALAPRLLLLDEPLAMLDPAAAAGVHDAILAVTEDRSRALVVVDHQLRRWLDDVDRIVVLGEHGRVVADGPPGRVLAAHGAALAAAGLWVPGASTPSRTRRRSSTPPVLDAAKLGVRLSAEAGGPAGWAVRHADTALAAGAVTALTGPSGAGKSTLLAALAGLLPPTEGSVHAAAAVASGLPPYPNRWTSRELAARIAWTPQRPTDGFIARTVGAEIGATARALRRPAPPTGELLASIGLADRAGTDPRRLSGGEQRRLAVVTALAARSPVVLLDEPTVGQDRLTWTALVELLAAARDAGTAVGVATHDQLLVDALADTVTVLPGPRAGGA